MDSMAKVRSDAHLPRRLTLTQDDDTRHNALFPKMHSACTQCLCTYSKENRLSTHLASYRTSSVDAASHANNPGSYTDHPALTSLKSRSRAAHLEPTQSVQSFKPRFHSKISLQDLSHSFIGQRLLRCQNNQETSGNHTKSQNMPTPKQGHKTAGETKFTKRGVSLGQLLRERNQFGKLGPREMKNLVHFKAYTYSLLAKRGPRYKQQTSSMSKA